MPQLPSYERKASAPAADIPNIPSYLVGEEYREIAYAGNQMANFGLQWQEKISDAQASAELSAAHADAAVKLEDLKNKTLSSPEFQNDPETARANWQKEAKSITESAGMGIRNWKARQAYQGESVKMLGAHTIGMSDQVRRQQIEIVKGQGMGALTNFTNAAVATDNDAAMFESIKGGHTAIEGMRSSGAINEADAVKMHEQFNDSVFVLRVKRAAIADPAGAEALRKKYAEGGMLSQKASIEVEDHLRPFVNAQRTSGIVDSVMNGTAPAGGGSYKLPADLPKSTAEIPHYSTFKAMSEKYNVPLHTVLALAHAEGGFNPQATSPTGVVGVMQTTKQTTRDMGLDPEKRNVPEVSIEAGVKYLRHLADTRKIDLNDPAAVVMAYTTPAGGANEAYIGKVGGLQKHYQGVLGGTKLAAADTGTKTDAGQAITSEPAPAPAQATGGEWTVERLRGDMAGYRKQLEDTAMKLYPNEKGERDKIVSAGMTKAQQKLNDFQMSINQDHDVLQQAIMDPQKNIQSPDDIRKDPLLADRYSRLFKYDVGKAKSIDDQLKQKSNGERQKLTQDKAAHYQWLIEMHDNPDTREQFIGRDIAKEDFHLLTDSQVHEIQVLHHNAKLGKSDGAAVRERQLVENLVKVYADPKPPASDPEGQEDWEQQNLVNAHRANEAIKAEKKASGKAFLEDKRVQEIVSGEIGRGYRQKPWYSPNVRARGYEAEATPEPYKYDDRDVPAHIRRSYNDQLKDIPEGKRPLLQFDSQDRLWYYADPAKPGNRVVLRQKRSQ